MYNKEQITTCQGCKFKTACIFSELETGAQKEWQTLRNFKKFKDGQPIYAENENPTGVFIVCKGRVKIYSTDYLGQQLITWIRHPGEMFGHLALFSGNGYSCNAESMGEAFISLIAGPAFNKLMEKFPRISYLMLKKMSIENKAMQLKLKDTAYKPAKAKVAHTLAKHISYKSKNTETPTIYGVKRTEIAEITGLALETVVRILSDFEKKKMIERSPSHIKILDLQALLKISHQQK
ncbi:MAG: hypothetical protein COT17_04990 [Elusimicrobia bacterium CG08_land_8_20_14_0_20_51_18]|nr:MAG: hypothetical protein COT17_04990 [Elusimicrobia bacterium CG08_land_8_20_14_0_20_51_18]